MKKKVLVRAAPINDDGLSGMARVPKENTVRRYITEDCPVLVDLTPYYLRKIALGDLVVCKEEKKTKKEGAKKWPI